jgi:hypothetical protein
MTEEGFLDRFMFSDESIFHISGKVHRYNLRLGGIENPHEMVQREKASPKIDVFVQRPHEIFMGLSFSVKTLTATNYLENLQT